MAKLALVNGIPRMTAEASAVSIYDETYSVGGTITTGTPITLPSSGTYNSDELEVRLNGQRLESVVDYNYVSTPPRTQVSFTFDLVLGDSVNFRVDRVP
jgi:hypothetical protein